MCGCQTHQQVDVAVLDGRCNVNGVTVLFTAVHYYGENIQTAVVFHFYCISLATYF